MSWRPGTAAVGIVILLAVDWVGRLPAWLRVRRPQFELLRLPETASRKESFYFPKPKTSNTNSPPPGAKNGKSRAKNL
ncbi:MAG: hypothetical protein NZ602_04185 [Thermoguttaceae bacterium]|nr:hypothetical protein [Thermoguttaceae bacterium]MDW8037426.1 hypothetical protein [Thermoguttaceae bacterium]